MSENQPQETEVSAGTPEPVQPEPQKQPEENSEVNYLDMYLGEGKKYADIEQAAKGLAKKAVHADSFIETLKNENAELKAQLEQTQARTKTVDEILAEIRTPSDKQTHPSENKETENMNVDIDKLISDKLAEQERQRATLVKQQTAKQKLIEAFGSDEEANRAIKEYVGDDPSKDAIVKTMAANSPEDLVKLLGKSGGTKAVTPTSGGSSINTSNVPANTGISWSQVKKLKKEDPAKYNKMLPEIQKQIEAYKAAGKDFFQT